MKYNLQGVFFFFSLIFFFFSFFFFFLDILNFNLFKKKKLSYTGQLVIFFFFKYQITARRLAVGALENNADYSC